VPRAPKSLALILICLTALTSACCHADDALMDRPLAWLSDESGAASASLRRAISLPSLKRPASEMGPCDVSGMYLDMSHSFGIKDEAEFRAKAYEVLDATVSAERRIEEARKTAPCDDQRYVAAYCFLKYRLKFAQALARLAVSQRMADSGASSYCLQAMESAIDCLKASAEARDEFEKLKSRQGYRKVTDPSAGTIRAFRESLLRIWHASKSRGSLTPIREMDIGRTINETMIGGVKDTKARKEIDRLFRWLGTSSAGNHPDPPPVE